MAAMSGSPAKKLLRLSIALRIASGLFQGVAALLVDGVLESGGDGSGGEAACRRRPAPALGLVDGGSAILGFIRL